MENIYQIRMTVQHIADLMETLVAYQAKTYEPNRTVSLSNDKKKSAETDQEYSEAELMTIKEAMAYIPVSRSKLYQMRKEGVLVTIERNSRQKRLLRSQVEAARVWSRNKGKW